MKQKQTPNDVAQRFGLTYDPVRVRMVEKKKVRFNGNKLEEVCITTQDDTIKLSIIVCMALGFWGASCIVIVLLWCVYTLLEMI